MTHFDHTINGAAIRLLNGKAQWQGRIGSMLKWSAIYRDKNCDSRGEVIWAETPEQAMAKAYDIIGTHERIQILPDWEFNPMSAGWSLAEQDQATVWFGEELAVQHIAARNSELFRSAPIGRAAE